MNELGYVMQTSLSQSIFDVISGAKSGSEAIKSFALAILDSLNKSLSDYAASGILSAIGSIIPGIGGGTTVAVGHCNGMTSH